MESAPRATTTEDGEAVAATASPAAAPRELHYAGHRWTVVAGDRRGNHFSPANAVVDARGRLFLGIARQAGQWTAAELELAEPVGYGDYQLVLDSPTGFPDNVVLSFGISSVDWEFAVQLSRWAGRPRNAQFVFLRPDESDDDVLETFSIPPATAPTRHRLRWSAERIELISSQARSRFLRGEPAFHQSRIDVPLLARDARLRLGFWLYRGDPPGDGKDQRLWVRDILVKS